MGTEVKEIEVKAQFQRVLLDGQKVTVFATAPGPYQKGDRVQAEGGIWEVLNVERFVGRPELDVGLVVKPIGKWV